MSTDARVEEYVAYCREMDAQKEQEVARARAAHTRESLERLQRGAGVIDSPQVLRALEAAWDAGRASATGARP